ncbi:hypothetical protein AB0451_03155 [Streptomyces sp. NPDC052000]|uniref:hypothetical protein n=1 Tax=Streptomyces sp. NPDC052000 TaxID=3155676 RepID=UPI00344FD689
MTEQPDVPAPISQPTGGPACTLCGGPACVHWQRRLTDDEFTEYLHASQSRRDELTLLADSQQAPPDFGPLPLPADCTRAVYGCVNHAVSLDAASLIHTKTCTAPNAKDLPHCDCTPEPAPPPEPDPTPTPLPVSWGGTGKA